LTSYLVVGLVVLMAITIQLYARKRRLDNERLQAADAKISIDEQLTANS
jgi:protoporphyrinogen IX oxidase